MCMSVITFKKKQQLSNHSHHLFHCLIRHQNFTVRSVSNTTGFLRFLSLSPATSQGFQTWDLTKRVSLVISFAFIASENNLLPPQQYTKAAAMVSI